MNAKVEQTFYAYCEGCDWQSEVFDTEDFPDAEALAMNAGQAHDIEEGH